MMENYDVIVIGAGQAGPSLAVRFAEAGYRVALIERQHVGGTCVNTGCMPTKTLVASARVAHLAKRAGDFGVLVDHAGKIDMPRVSARARKVVANARNGLETWLSQADRLKIIRGHARFIGPKEVQVGYVLSAPRIFINVGGRARYPDLPGISEVDCLTNTSILALDQLHLTVIGGSYIGLEFAQMYRRFGAKVTVIERGPALIGREDDDVSEAIKLILEEEGISCRLNANCISFRRHSEGVQVGLDCDTGSKEVTGSHVLLAMGRVPNTDDLGIDVAGVAVDARGYIIVEDTLATIVPGIWALGDCNGNGAFTHRAYNDFEIVAANLIDGESRRVSDRVRGYALYIDPPLGRVGLTERVAGEKGWKLLRSIRPMTRVGRAVERDETRGFMKVIADAESKRTLGVAILGIEGEEAIHGIVDAMSAEIPYLELEWAVPIHPTVSELIPTLLRGLTAT